MKLGHDLHLWIRTCHYVKFIKFKKMVAHEILQNTHTAYNEKTKKKKQQKNKTKQKTTTTLK